MAAINQSNGVGASPQGGRYVDYRSLSTRGSGANDVAPEPLYADLQRGAHHFGAQAPVPLGSSAGYLGSQMPAAKIGATIAGDEGTIDHAYDAAPPAPAKSSAGAHDLDITDKTLVISRQFLITFVFTLQEAASNPDVLKWTPQEGDLHIFQTKPKKSGQGGAPSIGRVGDLTKVVVLEAAVASVHTDVPIPVAVDISGMRGNKYSGSVRAPFIIPGATHQFMQPPIVIHKPDDTLLSLVQNKYSHLDPNELMRGIYSSTSWEAREAPGIYCSVPTDHPIAEMITRPKNMEILGITHEDLRHAGWDTGRFEFRTDQIEACRDIIRTKVIDRVPFTDFSDLTVRLRHAHSLKMDDERVLAHVTSDPRIRDQLMKQPISVNIQLELKYVIWDKSVVTGKQSHEKKPKSFRDPPSFRSYPIIPGKSQGNA